MMALVIIGPTAESVMTDDQLRIVCAAARRFRPIDIDPEDWTQSMVAWVLGHMNSYDPERGAFTTWVYQIVRRERGHHVKRQVERRKTMRVMSIGEYDLAAPGEDLIGSTENSMVIANDVGKALLFCLPHERYAVQAWLDDQSFAVAGKQLGQVRATISRNWRNALQRMKRVLRRMGYGSDQPGSL